MTEIILDESQQRAVELIGEAGFLVVTGGAGVGKTTVLKMALQQMDALAAEHGRPVPVVFLAAPTGKAARRMQEATGREAMTLHRLLGWSPDGWVHGADDQLACDLVVVDEASMIDIFMAEALFDAVDERTTRVVFVGDANQLPSVGPGFVFGDLLASGAVPSVCLETVHRQARESWVYKHAPMILEGVMPSLASADDFEFVECEDPVRLQKTLLDVYQAELNRVDAQDQAGMFEAVQILVPQKKGPIGCELINQILQRVVQTTFSGGLHNGYQTAEGILYADDKVLQTRNNYDLGVMNGETGIVVGQNGKRLVVTFDGETKEYTQYAARDLLLGYTITIHKSQGSGWPTVIVIAHSLHSRMLSRQLLYTAITRAEQRLVIIGDHAGLERAVSNARVQERQTGLVERLQETD